MWPRGVMAVGLDKSRLKPEMQAKVWRPSQLTAQDPQMPSLQDLFDGNYSVYFKWFISV